MRVDIGQGKRIRTLWALSLVFFLMAGATGAGADKGAVLGVMVEALSFEEIDSLGLSLGVRVRGIAPASPAATGGMKPGDIIIALDGTPVYSPQRLQWILSKRRAGEPIAISVRRGDAETGEVLELSVAPASSKAAAGSAVAPSAPGRAWLGIRMEPMDNARRQHDAVPLDRGVLIADVGTDSPAAKAGVVSGDVLLRIDRREIRMLGDVYRALAFFDPGETVELEVFRDGDQQVLEATLGERMPRRAMPPVSGPFGQPSLPQSPHFRMAPPQRWPQGMQEFHNFMQIPPQRWRSGPAGEKFDGKLSL
jgi:S1-C subfamily serine protease